METKHLEAIESYSEFLNHNGMDLEIFGQTFDEPCHKAQGQSYNTRVTIIDCEFGRPVLMSDTTPYIYYFVPEHTKDELIATVKEIKSKDKYLPK